MSKNYNKKIRKKQDNDVDADVAQLEWSNNKCYASTFRYIQITNNQSNTQFHNLLTYLIVSGQTKMVGLYD